MTRFLPVFVILTCLPIRAATAAPPSNLERQPNDKAGRDAARAVDGLTVADGLEATLFAAEPLMANPTNIDIDHLGRVWVCEVLNYRRFRNQDIPERTEGDRILILEDADSDGVADSVRTFHQGRDVDSAHGICVLDNRVLISCADKVFYLIDDDRDLQADRREILFTGIGGSQHDHGIHAFVFGPDGKLYFNFGNEGQQIRDRYGKPIIDLAGNEVSDRRRPYQQGMVFRCNPDGSEFETLAWNFRNNWEVCVDSFGTLWQSDNDDDGNRSTRINFVMEFGNYGYQDELTGAGWREPRTGQDAEIPRRHWHLNDPGVVPNLLQTGAGSPTGIVCYEGKLLPEEFRQQLIHCDAGPNIVRAYRLKKSGAGYTADVVPILEGTRDKWFRPTDVCVAPDGSVIIADWYDPGVGGHLMQDVRRGRLFRVAPPGSTYSVPRIDLSTIDGAITALRSPNHATRYLAWTALHKCGQEAEPALTRLFRSEQNPRIRARALWLLSKLRGDETSLLRLRTAAQDANPDIRITAVRAARQRSDRSGRDSAIADFVESLIDDPAPEVRRECLIALRHVESTSELCAVLATRHHAADRWFLEALGIAAGKQWDQVLDAWLQKVGGDWKTPAGRDIIWRSRAKRTPELLARIITDESVPADELPRYLRAFDFLTGPERNAAISELTFIARLPDDRRSYVRAEAVKRLEEIDPDHEAEYRGRLNQILQEVSGTRQFVRLVDRFELSDRYSELLALAQARPADQSGVEAIRLLLARNQMKLIREALIAEEAKLAEATAEVLGHSADGRAASLLLEIAGDSGLPLPLRRAALGNAAKSRNGARDVISLVQSGKLDTALHQAAAAALHGSESQRIRAQAGLLFPLPPSKDNQPLPPFEQLAKMRGSVPNGRVVFNTTGTCMKCHVVNGIGRGVGPDLSEIGNKLSREAMIHSILYPSAGVSHNYETYTILTDDGNIVAGIVSSRSDQSISIKGADAIVRTFQHADIDEIVKQEASMMPADLQKVMTAQEMIDVVEYMLTLKVAKIRAPAID